MPADLSLFHDGKPPSDVLKFVDHVRQWEGISRVVVLPDAHVGGEACVGVAVATQGVVYPTLVGTDLGCGMAAVRLPDPGLPPAEALARLRSAVPTNRHAKRRDAPPNPESLSDPGLSAIARRDGAVQFATLGRGNHFLELHAADDGSTWLLVHSGSRGIGASVAIHHTRADQSRSGVMRRGGLRVDSDVGRRYLADLEWCRAWAAASRREMLGAAATALGSPPDWRTLIECDHNHVRSETHGGVTVWVHRKGVTSAGRDEPGVIAGSMGTPSFLTVGLGNPASLCSSSHGAGRVLSRTEARRRLTPRDLRREVSAAIDTALTVSLVEECPGAYRDIRRVMRAQRDLTRATRELTPLAVHKGA